MAYHKHKMKIEIMLTDNIHEKTSGSTCFESSSHIRDTIGDCHPIQGIVRIDNEFIKFCFSSMGMDGDIFSNNENNRLIIKYLIPTYVYGLMKEKSPLVCPSYLIESMNRKEEEQRKAYEKDIEELIGEQDED